MIGTDLRSMRVTEWTGTANFTYAGTAPTSYGRRCPRKAGASGSSASTRSHRKPCNQPRLVQQPSRTRAWTTNRQEIASERNPDGPSLITGNYGRRRRSAQGMIRAPGISDLKLFELDTMCPLVTLGDRAEPVVVHFDCDQFRPAEPSWAHGKMRTTGRAVPDRGKQRVYVQVTAVRRSSPLARLGPRRVLEQELERNSIPEALSRAPARP